MPFSAYSPRINHAMAFAAKHHRGQNRKGSDIPYITHPANVAIILARYGCDEETIVAGILHDVVEDCVRDGWTRPDLEERIGDKFGRDVLEAVLDVTELKLDETGAERPYETRKSEYLAQIEHASDRGRWVCAADKIHNGRAILADLEVARANGKPADDVWSRFKKGRDETIAWYGRVHAALRRAGFEAAVMDELRSVADDLQREAR